MRKIDVQVMIQFLNGYLGKEVEIGTNPLWTVNTYQAFRLKNDENELTFYDGEFNASRQEIVVSKNQIVEIVLSEGRDIYESVVTINLLNSRIDLTISSMPTKCFKCHSVIDIPYDTLWSIQGTGGYGSKFPDEKLDIPICDSCLYYNILGYKDGDFDE